MSDMENKIVLIDDDGNEVEFEHVITIKKDGEEFALLKELGDDSDDMFAFKIDNDEQGDILTPVDDEDEIIAIQSVYDEIVNSSN